MNIAGERRAGNRWPQWVYGQGAEPDYRFTLANERTLLAYFRTALACLALGVAVSVVPLDAPAVLTRWLTTFLVSSATVVPAMACVRWATSERAIRQAEALPGLGWITVTLATLLVTSGSWALATS